MQEIKIDRELTPENSEEKGLVWVKDINVDLEAPEEILEEVRGLLKSGYFLGLPAGSTERNSFYGLYKNNG